MSTEPMTLAEALQVAEQVSPLPQVAHRALQALAAVAPVWRAPDTAPTELFAAAVLVRILCCAPAGGGLTTVCGGRQNSQWIIPIQHEIQILGWAPLPPPPADSSPLQAGASDARH